MTKELKCSDIEVALGLGLYAAGFALTPLITSSFSEVSSLAIFFMSRI